MQKSSIIWIVGVSIETGMLIPARERRRTARQEEQVFFETYNECLEFITKNCFIDNLIRKNLQNKN